MAKATPDWSKWPSEWHAAAGLVLGIALMAPYGRLGPWMDGTPGILFFLPIGAAFILYGLCNLALALATQRPFLVSLLGVGMAVAAGLYMFLPASVEASWRAKFKQELPLMREAVGLMKKHQASSIEGDYRLPPRFRSLWRYGPPELHQDAEGHTWFTFPIVTYGIDNSQGFSWSESGLPPPRGAFHEITRSEPMGEGWYMFWST